MKTTLTVIVLLAVVLGALFTFSGRSSTQQEEIVIEESGYTDLNRTDLERMLADADLEADARPVPEPRPEPEPEPEPEPYTAVTTIGHSVENRPILAYQFGNGPHTIMYVGALHGGYEWNTAVLAYTMIDYLAANPGAVPDDVSVVVVPVANPDGLAKVTGTSERFVVSDAPQFDYAFEVSTEDMVVQGRYNSNGIDLNRNFDCEWQPAAVWRTNEVSPGPGPFSEPEARAIRDTILTKHPEVAVFFHSASNGVYPSRCDGVMLPETWALLEVYSDASGYPGYEDYDYYHVTGDAVDWLTTQKIPALTVELSTHSVIEWEKNKAAMEALIAYFSNIR